MPRRTTSGAAAAAYLPDFLPIVHPSPLNFRWQAKNPWFEADVVPALRERVAQLLVEREKLAGGLARSPLITRVWPSDANFLLVDCTDPDEVLARVRAAGLIIRDVRQPALPKSLRISVGTPEQNARLLESLA